MIQQSAASSSFYRCGLWTHLRLIEVDDDFEVGLSVVEPVCDGRPCAQLQLRREGGLQPLHTRHHLDSLHPFFTQTKHLTAEVLHLLVVDGVEFM